MISFTKKTAKISRNKITATAIALLLMLSMTASLVVLPPAKAAVTYHYSYTYVSTGSNVVGLGQQILLVYWTADIPPDIGETAGTVPGYLNRAGWSGCSFNVTTPEGVTTTYPMGQSDSIGGGYMLYTPTTVGTYTVTASFPATWKNTTTNQIYYTAADSKPVTFDVQQDQIPSWTESPLPIAYWTRPINNAARLWSALPGNWLGGAWQQPAGAAGGTTSRFLYGVGTETSHILWTRPQYIGGYMDARFNVTGYMTGHYQGLDFSAIIINGHIFAPYRVDSTKSEGYNVYDLYTGDLIGYYNETMPSYGQIYNYDSPNQHGGYSMLWRSVSGLGSGNGTCLEMLDGYTLPLKRITIIANCSTSGTQVVGWNGELTYYNIVNKGSSSAPDYYLTMWNNTAITTELNGPSGTNYWQWRPGRIAIHDGSTGFSLNVSIPTPYGPRNSVSNQTGTIRTVRQGDQAGNGGYVILGTTGQNNEDGAVQGQLWSISLDRIAGTLGAQLWTSTFTPPFMSLATNESAGAMGSGFSMVGVYPEDGIILFHSTKRLTYWGYDMKTGAELWTGAQEPQMNYYSTQYNYYKGLLLTSGYGGVVIAYNMTTGVQAWNFTASNIGLESPYGNYPINIFAICDGKIYTLAGEHSITQPLWRGPNIRCINATDGTEIWNLLGMGADNGAHLTGQYMQMGDGKVVGLNYFDGQLYCIGPGPSATTVSAPQSDASVGSLLTITGTVTDQTPTGRRNGNYNFDFTLKGTPAISDASMGRWMEYLFQQQAMPTDATGVPVSLDTVDPNGNYFHIGDVTSDINGNYGLPFTPDVPGMYQIIATFAGSRSYTPSSATTYLAVGEAPAATAAPTPTPTSVADMYFVPAIAGLFALIIVVLAVVILLLLKKRP